MIMIIILSAAKISMKVRNKYGSKCKGNKA